MSKDIAVVSGAASGIGFALTRALLARNLRVIAIDLEPSELNRLGADCLFTEADVRDESGLREIAGQHDTPIKYVFANAGIGVPGSVLQGALDRWEWAHRVNVMGVIHLARAFWPRLVAGQGAFIGTVSAAALQSYPGNTIYRATKAALLSVLESLHYESRGAVRIHALCPGMVRSRIVEVSRYDDWRDDAEAALPPDPFAAIVHEAMKSAENAEAFAERVLDALPSRPPFYWITHAETLDWIEGRFATIRDGAAPFSQFGPVP